MAEFVLKKLEDWVVRVLASRAAKHGNSLEDEMHQIITFAARGMPDDDLIVMQERVREAEPGLPDVTPGMDEPRNRKD